MFVPWLNAMFLVTDVALKASKFNPKQAEHVLQDKLLLEVQLGKSLRYVRQFDGEKILSPIRASKRRTFRA
jgi:hypothetical protein